MALPPRVFMTLTEAAARWGCSPSDIVEWSADNALRISVGIPPVQCGDVLASGFVQVHAADILPMFRRCGTGPRRTHIRRLKTEDAEPDWLFVTSPCEGIEIEAADLIILMPEMGRFEDHHDIFRRGAGGGAGPDMKYTWVEMLQWLAVRLHDKGVPESIQALVDDCRQWFIDQSPDGEHPSDRSVRRYVQPIWKGLRDQTEA